jgi:hypothetical protein
VAGIQEKCVSFLKELGYELRQLDNGNKIMPGLEDFIAVHKDNINAA